MKVAIVHPSFSALGGAEKVVEAIASLFPGADIFVLIVIPGKIPPSLLQRRIIPSFLNDLPWTRKNPGRLSFLFPLAIDSLDLSPYNLVISSAGPVTFGVNVSQDAVHLCYCHSPERSWWDRYALRQQQLRPVRRLVYTARTAYIRTWEYNAAQRVDQFIANSNYIATRVHKYFRREATVIYPPVDTSVGYIADGQDDYFLTVGRLIPPKRLEVIVRACNHLGRRLLIAGTGPEERNLKAIAGPTIEFLGFVPATMLPAIYARCRAFLFAADEDFGIAPVEAQSFGRPVIAYGYGGSLETVRVGRQDQTVDTGLFFSEQTVESLVDGILRFEAKEASFKPHEIQLYAKEFDTTVFLDKMLTLVNAAVRKE